MYIHINFLPRPRPLGYLWELFFYVQRNNDGGGRFLCFYICFERINELARGVNIKARVNVVFITMSQCCGFMKTWKTKMQVVDDYKPLRTKNRKRIGWNGQNSSSLSSLSSSGGIIFKNNAHGNVIIHKSPKDRRRQSSLRYDVVRSAWTGR